MVVMVTYDLNSAGQKYEQVIQAIKDSSTGTYCSYWKSSYLIQTNLSPNQIQEKIKPFLDSNDSLIAIEVKNNYQGWLKPEQWTHIKENIFG